ncbi:unnamed protein product [Ixodes hexagonus]
MRRAHPERAGLWRDRLPRERRSPATLAATTAASCRG